MNDYFIMYIFNVSCCFVDGGGGVIMGECPYQFNLECDDDGSGMIIA